MRFRRKYPSEGENVMYLVGAAACCQNEFFVSSGAQNSKKKTIFKDVFCRNFKLLMVDIFIFYEY